MTQPTIDITVRNLSDEAAQAVLELVNSLRENALVEDIAEPGDAPLINKSIDENRDRNGRKQRQVHQELYQR